MKKFSLFLFFMTLFVSVCIGQKKGPITEDQPKDPTIHTIKANKSVLNELNFSDTLDYANSRRGWIAAMPSGEIKDASGKVVWDMKAYDFLLKAKPKDAPLTVNPSLWRQEQLNCFAGLFEVVEGHIYQIRGYDLSVMSLIQGNTGWIVIDPLVSAETAKAGLALANQYVKNQPVSAVIFTHSHIDHYGGVLGLGIAANDGKSSTVPLYAPQDFLEHAVSENIIAGNAMGRRASYMYGNTMKNKDARSQIGSGLGKTTSSGQSGILTPNRTIYASQPGRVDTVDGVLMQFWNTPDAEAPSEMMFYFPDYKALCAAEEVTHTLHNTYSLRGTKVRDPLSWSQYIGAALDEFGPKTDVIFASHHWPTWGRDTIAALMAKQRDLYKFINDQTLRLANQGYTMIEIAEHIKLPESLAKEFTNRSYYGTVNHNVKATYQRYLGWFDGNPANLHSLPPEEAGVKYVEFMGGPDTLLKKARKSYEKGEYRWVAMVVNHLVFADPKNMEARRLLADAYEQMGYQAESGPWRNFYLTGARELREPNRVKLLAKANPVAPSVDDLNNMPLDDYFEFLAIHLNDTLAAGKQYAFNVKLTDIDTQYVLRMENAVLNSYPIKAPIAGFLNVGMTQLTLDSIMIKGGQAGVDFFKKALKTPPNSKIHATISGKPEEEAKWYDFLHMLEYLNFWFNIIEP
ncbi:MAG: alkyl sulfatase dimerization domain-containing protein [Bacteroidota bacterium]